MRPKKAGSRSGFPEYQQEDLEALTVLLPGFFPPHVNMDPASRIKVRGFRVQRSEVRNKNRWGIAHRGFRMGHINEERITKNEELISEAPISDLCRLSAVALKLCSSVSRPLSFYPSSVICHLYY